MTFGEHFKSNFCTILPNSYPAIPSRNGTSIAKIQAPYNQNIIAKNIASSNGKLIALAQNIKKSFLFVFQEEGKTFFLVKRKKDFSFLLKPPSFSKKKSIFIFSKTKLNKNSTVLSFVKDFFYFSAQLADFNLSAVFLTLSFHGAIPEL